MSTKARIRQLVRWGVLLSCLLIGLIMGLMSAAGHPPISSQLSSEEWSQGSRILDYSLHQVNQQQSHTRDLQHESGGSTLEIDSISSGPRWLVAQNPDKALRLQRLAEADQFYLEGNLQMAEVIGQEVKEPFEGVAVAPAEPIEDIESARLSPAAKVFWREAQAGMEQGLNTKIFQNLQALTEQYPDFLPGHLTLAEVCDQNPEECEDNADGEQPQNSVDVIERATALYPDNTQLLDAKLALFERIAERRSGGEGAFQGRNLYFAKYFEASIAARQFALTHPDHPESSRYASLADDYYRRYQAALAEAIQGSEMINQLIGTQEGAQLFETLRQGESGFGDQIVQSYKSQYSLVSDPEVVGYINQIGQKLATSMGRPDFTYEFYVINNDNSLNAFALPGGKVFINSGVILASRSEAELAGVLAHEISHTALSHKFLELAEFAPLKDGSDLERMLSARFNRKQEQESDILGTRALAQADYAADGLRNYLVILRDATQRSNPRGNAEDYLSTHPAPDTRVRYLETLILQNGYNRYAYEGVARHSQIQSQISGSPVIAAASGSSSGSAGSPLAPETGAAPDPSQGQGSASKSDAQAQPASSSVDQEDVAIATPPEPETIPDLTNSAGSADPSSATFQSGPVALAIGQELDGVIIRLDGATVLSRGMYTVNVVVDNQSDYAFGFVPLFATVEDENGSSVSSRISFGEVGQDALIEPQSTMSGELTIINQPWNPAGSQGLMLTIKEGTTQGRVFRIRF